jgi:hypothetical protein
LPGGGSFLVLLTIYLAWVFGIAILPAYIATDFYNFVGAGPHPFLAISH